MNDVFNVDKLDVFTPDEKKFYTKWTQKINLFIDGKLDISEIKNLNKIAETIVKKQHDRISIAFLMWRMRNNNIKEIY